MLSKAKLDELVKKVKDATQGYMLREGFYEDEVGQYSRVHTSIDEDGRTFVQVYLELDLEACLNLAHELSDIAVKYRNDLYFDVAKPGILVCVID